MMPAWRRSQHHLGALLRRARAELGVDETTQVVRIANWRAVVEWRPGGASRPSLAVTYATNALRGALAQHRRAQGPKAGAFVSLSALDSDGWVAFGEDRHGRHDPASPAASPEVVAMTAEVWEHAMREAKHLAATVSGETYADQGRAAGRSRQRIEQLVARERQALVNWAAHA